MFKLKPVENCPHTRKSCGVVNMSPELISQLAAAVYDVDEWAIVLTGERRENGYVIDVTDYFVPPQERSGGNVVVRDVDTDANGYLEDGRRVVGVIHSHHTMGAFFSRTDVTTLNTRFPMSIVIAQNKRTYLGFEYQGVGKVVLPCGATGEIRFEIQPTVGPIVAEVKRVVHGESDLGDCSRVKEMQSDQFHIHNVAACGLEEPVSRVASAFGSSSGLLDVVKQLPRPAPVVKPLPQQSKLLGQQPIPLERGKNWFSELFERLSSGKSETKEFKDEAYYSSQQEDNNDGYSTVFCEACRKYDDFWRWECSCGQGEYCDECNVGHDAAIGCPKEVRVFTS